MATDIARKVFASGQTLYAVVWYQATYFDWVDNALETPSAGSDANAVLTMSEHARDSNATSSYATAAFDLATLWDYLAPRDFEVMIYSQQGGSPDLTNDPVIDTQNLRVILGRNNPHLDFKLIPGFKKDENPSDGTFWAILTADGDPVDMANTSESPDPTLVVAIRREGDAGDFVSPSSATSPNAAGHYYVTFTDPAYDVERSYFVTLNLASDEVIRVQPFRAAG